MSPFSALALALVAGTLAMNANLTGGEWRPSIVQAYEVPEGERIYVVFQDNGQLVGSGGCNNFFGAYKLFDDGTIKIGPLASTKKGCPGKFELETAFFAALRSAAFYEQDGTTLVLFGADGRELARFVKADEA